MREGERGERELTLCFHHFLAFEDGFRVDDTGASKNRNSLSTPSVKDVTFLYRVAYHLCRGVTSPLLLPVTLLVLYRPLYLPAVDSRYPGCVPSSPVCHDGTLKTEAVVHRTLSASGCSHLVVCDWLKNVTPLMTFGTLVYVDLLCCLRLAYR